MSREDLDTLLAYPPSSARTANPNSLAFRCADRPRAAQCNPILLVNDNVHAFISQSQTRCRPRQSGYGNSIRPIQRSCRHALSHSDCAIVARRGLAAASRATARDGHSAETELLREWPKEGPKPLWSVGVGSGWSGPVVVGGKVLIHHRVGDNEVLQCLNAVDGNEIWKYTTATGYTDDFQFDDGPRATPSVVGNSVYTLGADGKLSCVSFDKGQRIWDRDLSVDYPSKKGYFGVATSPLVDDERVYVNVGAKGAGMVAFDRKTGKDVWKSSDDEASYSSPVLATLAAKPRLVCFTRAGLLVLNPATGERIQARPFRARIQASVNAATPLVSGNQIFLTASYNTGAILLEAANDDWKEIWKNDSSLSCHYNTPVKVGEFLFGVDGRQEAGPELHASNGRPAKCAGPKRVSVVLH